MNPRAIRIVFGLTTLMMAITAVAQDDAKHARDHRAAIAARFNVIQNVSLSYELQREFVPREVFAGQLPNGVTLQTKTGMESSREHFSFLRGNVRWEMEYSKETLESMRAKGVRTFSRRVRVHCEGVEESLVERDGGAPRGYIGRPKQFEMSIVDVALGLRAPEARGWLSLEEWSQMTLKEAPDGDIALTRVLESGVTEEWIFRPKLGYAIVRFRGYRGTDGKKFVDVCGDDFRETNGVMYPFRVTCAYFNYDEQEREVETTRWTAAISACRFNDPANTVGSYHIDWPKGTNVSDIRTRTNRKVE